MKKWISLFDLCPIRPGMRNDRAARITAMSYLRDCQEKEQRMEKQLLNTGEYILLRGKDSYNGLLQRVETNPVSRITGQAIMDLYNSVPKSYRKNAVFLMNTVTLNELSRSLDSDSRALLSYKGDGTFTLVDKPIVLCNAMPFIRSSCVPILFGDFSKVSIEDCGRDELRQEPYDGNPDAMQCSEIKFNPKVGFIPEGAPTKYEYSMGASSVPIGECTLQGYRFLGWRLYADKVDADNKPMNVNWHADPNTYEDDWTPPEQLGNLPKYDDYMGNYNGTGEPPTHIDENSYLVNNELNLNANFGNITLVAVFEPAYSGLKIVKEVKDGDAVDQQFIFSIVGKTDLSEDVNLQIVIAGEGSAFIHLPVGNYTVTELENWSWRYDVTNVEEDTFEMPMARTMLAASEVQPYCKIEIHDPEEGVELTFTNDRVNTQWLDASAIYQNKLK